MNYRYCFIILFCFISIGLLAKDNTTDTIKHNWKNESNIFKKNSIVKDIQKASPAQLKAMVRTLNLKVKPQTDSALRKALYDYYGVKPFGSTTQPTGDYINIERAGELRMLRVIEEDEENLHILGRVRMVLNSKDEEKNTIKKTIEADEIFINIKSKEISGIGHVYYKDNQLEYNGTQFYYNFSSNTGVLLKGKTKILKGGKSGLSQAYFNGEKIVQFKENSAILYNGKVTTCDEDNPHYFVKVSRLWIGKDGEWGMFNALISVGPIPLFYFPIWYHPKELSVHPVFGYKTRQGWFLNSTYYILGKKEEVEKDSKDVFGIATRRKTPSSNNLFTIQKTTIDNTLTQFYSKHKIYKKYPKFQIFPELTKIDLALRVFGDAYTNLGFYAGAFYYQNISFIHFPMELKILSDFAFSRKLWQDTENNSFTTYKPDDKNGSANDPYNTYYYLSANPLEYRTSQWLKLNGSLFKYPSKTYGVNLTYNMELEYASDYDYFRDFYARELYFSYMDVLTDSLKSFQNIQQTLSNFKTKEDATISSSKNNTQSFIKIELSPKKIPDLYGLKPLSNVKLSFLSDVNFVKTTIAEYNKASVDNPKENRYMLDYFTIPNLNFSMSGMLVDYKTFLKIPEVRKQKKKTKKNKRINIKDNLIKDMYVYINEKKNVDGSTDTSVIDYKLLLPLLSRSVEETKTIKNKNIFTYNNPLTEFDDVSYHKKKTTKESSKIKRIPLTNISQVTNKPNKTYTDISLVDFNLSYNFSNVLVDKFSFIQDLSDDTPWLDSFQKIFSGNFKPNEVIKQFNVNNKLNFNLQGSLTLLKINNTAIFQLTNPKLEISYTKDWDNMDIYEIYLKNQYTDSTDDLTKIDNDKTSKLNTNRTNSTFLIKYSQTINNELSFGLYRISGTKISTTMNFELFNYNELKDYHYTQLNDINKSDPTYEWIDPFFYSNRSAYEKIKQLNTSFILNVNILPKGNPHALSMSLTPHINWIIPSATITSMKTDLWNANQSDVSHDTNTLTEAQEYIYYRNNGENLQSKINEFFSSSNFWDGPNNWRKMFSNIAIGLKYSYTHKSKKILNINNTLTFVLDNMGKFSRGNGEIVKGSSILPWGIYPNESFSISAFDSLFSYSLSLTFSKEKDESGDIVLPSYSNNSVLQTYDEYNVIKAKLVHTFSFNLSGKLFANSLPDKLAKSTLVHFDTSLTFFYNKNKDWSIDKSHHLFYLNSQSLNFNALMNIININLTFQSYDFVGVGYGFELHSGTISLGYNVTEIPVFWRYFKFTFYPKLIYKFEVKHLPYYANENFSSPVSYSSTFFTANTLTFNLSMGLTIGKGTPFETTLTFEMQNSNKRMYNYYEDDGISVFFNDLGDSLKLWDISARRRSPFNLDSIHVHLEHKLHDWKLTFDYLGKPERSGTSQRYYWENTFTFMIEWKIQSAEKNQLMKMLNKTKVNETYKQGEWAQPVLSLDPDES